MEGGSMKTLYKFVVIACVSITTAWAMGSRTNSLKERCTELNSGSDTYKYFEGVLSKGYLFVMPYLPEPNLCKDGQNCVRTGHETASYVLNFKSGNGKTLSLALYGTKSELEDYAFKEGNIYAVCYQLDAVASEKNKREIWMARNLNMIEKIGE